MIIKRYKQIVYLILFLVVVLLFLNVFAILNFFNENSEVIFFDIGQGDGILIKTKNKQNILIDGGPDKNILDKLGRNLPFFVNKLDLVIATHPDADHIAGLVAVLEKYRVDLFLETGLAHDSEIYNSLKNIIAKKNIKTSFIDSRTIFDFGEGNILDIFYPNKSFVGQDISDNNDASVVARFSDQDVDYLLTGDATALVENRLLDSYKNILDSEILKIGHHGSNTSSQEVFIKKVNPELGVIQVGKDNRYDHPDFRVLKRLENLNIPILRNDTFGDIKFVSDGWFFWLK